MVVALGAGFDLRIGHGGLTGTFAERWGLIDRSKGRGCPARRDGYDDT